MLTETQRSIIRATIPALQIKAHLQSLKAAEDLRVPHVFPVWQEYLFVMQFCQLLMF
jgi:hypothetical protein